MPGLLHDHKKILAVQVSKPDYETNRRQGTVRPGPGLSEFRHRFRTIHSHTKPHTLVPEFHERHGLLQVDVHDHEEQQMLVDWILGRARRQVQSNLFQQQLFPRRRQDTRRIQVDVCIVSREQTGGFNGRLLEQLGRSRHAHVDSVLHELRVHIESIRLVLLKRASVRRRGGILRGG